MEAQKGLSGKTHHRAGYMLRMYKYLKDYSHFAVCARAWFLLQPPSFPSHTGFGAQSNLEIECKYKIKDWA